MVLRRGLALATVGLVAGLFGAMLSNRLLLALLYRVSPSDPMTLAVVAALLLAVATLAIIVPARAGTRSIRSRRFAPKASRTHERNELRAGRILGRLLRGGRFSGWPRHQALRHVLGAGVLQLTGLLVVLIACRCSRTPRPHERPPLGRGERALRRHRRGAALPRPRDRCHERRRAVTAVCAVIIPLAVGAALGAAGGPRARGGAAGAPRHRAGEPDRATEEGKRPTTGLGIAVLSGICIGVFLVCLQRTGPAAGLWPLAAARTVSVGSSS